MAGIILPGLRARTATVVASKNVMAIGEFLFTLFTLFLSFVSFISVFLYLVMNG